jgi:hypothetical protein
VFFGEEHGQPIAHIHPESVVIEQVSRLFQVALRLGLFQPHFHQPLFGIPEQVFEPARILLHFHAPRLDSRHVD